MTAISLAALAALTAVHLVAARLRFLEGVPRHVMLSVGGGVSVGYVFVHLLQELGAHHHVLKALGLSAYVIALGGFASFYGLERLAITSRTQQTGDSVRGLAFWTHAGSFALYNAVIGYLLRRDVPGGWELVLFTIAIGLHFVVTDHGVHEHYRTAYDRVGRWVLSAGLVLGYGVGSVTRLHEAVVAVAVAFLGGGVILNVIKEELPKERQSRFWAFAVGAAAYAALLSAL